ncbi:bile acid:sodium symporter family protein [Gordonia sp. LSe1-13]|uniref:Bile acid:sodium symporter family protein n=1 Tax=Gordonia sesuvii TaxID=3116777 RepID=A0ABU7M9E0_9ACTN|nr:bile acid:sodium symporter family protein [Gordonia sp. LSe1-13]
MESSFVAVGLPIALAVIMFGLGLSLTVADFRRVAHNTRAIAVILGCQMLLLPLVAFGLTVVFDLEPYLAVGLMILAASPGGTTSSVYSHLFRGDVALNVTLTAINSLLGLISLPIVVNLALNHFVGSDESVGMQPAKLLQVFAVVLIPVILGMVVRHRRPEFAARADKPVRIVSIVLLIGVVLGALLGEEKAMEYLARVGVVTTLFCVLSLLLGYLVPRVAGLTRGQSIASGFEVGIHNSTLAIAVALTALDNSEMAIAPAVYGILMFPLAALFGFAVRKLTRPREPVGAEGTRS